MHAQSIISAAQEELKSEADDRSAVVKNLSLQLLDVDSPIKILDIFEKDYLSKMSSDNGKGPKLARAHSQRTVFPRHLSSANDFGYIT